MNDNIKKMVKAEAKKTAIKNASISKEESDILNECLKEAKMPVKMTDKDFTLGEGELDIRKLCPENKEQMLFRTLTLLAVYGRNLSQCLIDLERLVMVLGKKLGIDDFQKETDDLMKELIQKVKN